MNQRSVGVGVVGRPGVAARLPLTGPTQLAETDVAETMSATDVAMQDVEVQVTGRYTAVTEVFRVIEQMPRALPLVPLRSDAERRLELTVTERRFAAPPIEPAAGP